MNLDRFGLTHSPFRARSDAAYVNIASRAPLLDHIQQTLLDGSGIAVLSSAAGLGKTTFCRELQRRVEADWLTALLQDCACTTRRSLLQAILYELGLPYTGLTEQESRLRLYDTIRDRQPSKAGLVLLVDEAQRLNDRLLVELRSLFNHDVDGVPLVRLLLCGDAVLEERLISPALESVNQRVVCHEMLLPISYEESAQILDHRITAAGGDGWEHVFTRPAMELLCLVSDGSPRNLEHLARRSLEIADRAREPGVSVESVRRGLNELKELPLQWNEPSNLDAYSERDSLNEGDIVDLRTELAEQDDAIQVRIGDELPPATSPLGEPAGVIEFGGDETDAAAFSQDNEELDELFTRTCHESNVLLEDSIESGLAETAVIEYGAPDEPLPSVSEAPAKPSWEEETIVVRREDVPESPQGKPSEGKQPARPAWIELEVDDRYAVLDADVPIPQIHAPRSTTLRAAACEAPADPPSAERESDTAVGDGIELSILKQARQLSDEVASGLRIVGSKCALPGVASANESEPEDRLPSRDFGALPEWDVVQPEWTKATEFTPVAVDLSTPLDTDQPPTDQSIERDDTRPLPAVEPIGIAAVDELAESDHSPIYVAESSPEGLSSPQHRIDDSKGHRPYSQLFSRLRRLRSRIRTGER